MLETLRLHFCERGLTRFLPNLDAMLCRIALHAGDIDAAELWYREKAPRDPLHLNVMKRYQYLTQAMVELADGKPDGSTAQLDLAMAAENLMLAAVEKTYRRYPYSYSERHCAVS